MLMSAAFLLSALVQFALGLLMAAMLGPQEFGLYAIAFAAAVIGQTLFFEWIRLSITRFQGRSARVSQRLTRFALGLSIAMVTVGGLVWFSGHEQRALALTIIISAIIWGLSECRGATLRAEFAERSYAIFLLTRSGAALAAMPLAASWSPKAETVLAAFAVSTLLALVGYEAYARLASQKTQVRTGVEPPPLRQLLSYAMPIIATNLAYLLLFFALRLFIASKLGLGEAGAFSLAFDLGMKLVMTLGTALDLYLFQLAVRAEESGGAENGRKQIARNLALVSALLAPAMLGLALIVPSIEVLVIAPAFRETFDLYLIGLVPGFLLFGMAQYAIHPAHQLEKRTFPLVLAALSAMAAAMTILMIGGVTRLFLGQIPAIALIVGMTIALAVLWQTLPSSLPIDWRGLLPRLALALGGLFAAVMGIRALVEPGMMALVASIVTGGVSYLALAWITNLAGCRDFLAEAKKNGA